MAMAWHTRCLAMLLLSVNSAAAGQTCASNPLCSQLGLTGNCCPANSGANLDCCGSETIALEAAPPKEEGSSSYQPPEVTQPWGHRQCLLWNGDGCESIRDEQLCKSSRDGRPWEMMNGREVRGSPCVWCNGKQCQDNLPNLCSSYGWLRPALGQDLDAQLNKGEKQIAQCTASQTTAETLTQVKEPTQTPNTDMTFTPMDGGVNRACRGSYLADTGYQAAIPRFGAGMSFKVWTASTLEECKAFCSNNCKGVEYHAAEQYCAIWHADVNFAVEKQGSECLKAKSSSVSASPFTAAEPTEAEMSCLSPWKGGCHSIEQKINCLSSKDGSDVDQILGLKVKGQACVWCEGPCTSNSNSQCEPYDYLKNGEGRAFSILHGRQKMNVASCFSDANNLGAAPDEEDTTCLKPANTGCNTIFDEATCLASRDNRSIKSVAGLRVQGEPCVWCGGGFCSTNNANLCEPYQFAVYGQQHAFNTFLAKDGYKVAACENGAVEAHSLTPESVAGSSGAVAAGGAATAGTATPEPSARAAEAGTQAAAASQAAGQNPQEQAAAAGEAAAAASSAAGGSAAEQTDAAAAAAEAASKSAGLTAEQQAAAGKSAAGVAAAPSTAVDFKDAASAGAAAAASAKNAGMTPAQQAAAAGAAAQSAAALDGLTGEQQAAAAGAAAMAAAVSDNKEGVSAGQALDAIPANPDVTPQQQAEFAGKAAATAAAAAAMLPPDQAEAAGSAAATAAQMTGMTATESVDAAADAAAAAGQAALVAPTEQAAFAGAAAAAAGSEAGMPVQKDITVAGEAAGASAAEDKLSPKDQAAAAGAAAASAAQKEGLPAEQQASVAGEAAADSGKDAGVSGAGQAEFAGAAASPAGKAAGMTPREQAIAAGAAAAAAAKAANLKPEEQAAAAGAAAASAAKAAGMTPKEQAQVAGDAAARAVKGSTLSGEEQSDAAGVAAAAAAIAAGMTAEEQTQVAAEAARLTGKEVGLSSTEIAAEAGEAADAAGKAAGMTPAQRAAASGTAAVERTVPSENEAEQKQEAAVGELEVEQKKDGTEALDTVEGNGNDFVQGEEATGGGWPWWATVLIVCAAVLLCTVLACLYNKKGKKEKKDRSGELKREYQEQGDDVELQAPLVKSQSDAFGRIDKDGDGMISRTEWEQAKAAQSIQTPQFAPVQPVPQVVPQLYSAPVPVAAPATASVNPSLVTQGAMVTRPGAPAAYPNDLFNQIDLNHNGTLDRREWAIHQQFTALDRNHDGIISPGEWQQGGRPM